MIIPQTIRDKQNASRRKSNMLIRNTFGNNSALINLVGLRKTLEKSQIFFLADGVIKFFELYLRIIKIMKNVSNSVSLLAFGEVFFFFVKMYMYGQMYVYSREKVCFANEKLKRRKTNINDL